MSIFKNLLAEIFPGHSNFLTKLAKLLQNENQIPFCVSRQIKPSCRTRIRGSFLDGLLWICKKKKIPPPLEIPYL